MRDGVGGTGGVVSAGEARRMAAAGALLLDVREDDEWAAGHAPEAVHVPMSRLAQRAGELPSGRTIVCVCHVGGRSAAVVSALVGGGWDAVNLDGGMEAWAAAGLPVVRDDGGPGAVV